MSGDTITPTSGPTTATSPVFDGITERRLPGDPGGEAERQTADEPEHDEDLERRGGCRSEAGDDAEQRADEEHAAHRVQETPADPRGDDEAGELCRGDPPRGADRDVVLLARPRTVRTVWP